MRSHVDFTRAHAHADTPPIILYARVHARRRSVSAREEPHDLPYERKTIACYPCTPPLTMETFGEKISAEACSGKEIAGLLEEEKMMMMNMMTRKS